MPAGPGTPTPHSAHPAGRHAALEGVRGVAALAVFGFHAWLYTRERVVALVAGRGLDDQILSQLRVGLVLFFVLSAFLLYGSWVRGALDGTAPPALGGYARRRLARIVPAYYLAIAAAVVLLWPLDDTPGVRLPPAGQLPLFLVFAQNQSPDTVLTLDPPTWTLAIEASFYLVLPALAWLALRARAPRLGVVGVPLALLAAGIAFNWWIGTDGRPTPQTVSKSLPAMLPYFALGMLTAALGHRWRPGARAAALVLGAGLALVLANAVLHAVADPGGGLAGTLRVVRDLPAAIGFAAIIAVAVARPPRALLLRPLTFAGEISYGFFLWHVPVLLVLRGHGLLPLSVAGAVVVALPLSLLAGWLSWRCVEQPAIAWSRRRRSAEQAAEAGEEPAPVVRP